MMSRQTVFLMVCKITLRDVRSLSNSTKHRVVCDMRSLSNSTKHRVVCVVTDDKWPIDWLMHIQIEIGR